MLRLNAPQRHKEWRTTSNRPFDAAPYAVTLSLSVGPVTCTSSKPHPTLSCYYVAFDKRSKRVTSVKLV
jgi:hypothetical protein